MPYLLDTDVMSNLVRNPIGKVYSRIREVGEQQVTTSVIKAGCPIGGNDLLIAAQALALGYTVVTGNQREFMRVHELTVENWLH